MIARLLDIILGINACIAIGTWATVKYRRKKKSDNLEHVRQLEEENKEIDEIRKRISKG